MDRWIKNAAAKIKTLLVLVAITFAGISFISCNDDDEDDGCKTIEKSLLDANSNDVFSKFTNNNLLTYGDTLIIVNDSEHLRSLIGEDSLQIDFSKNTLILGQVTSSYSGTEIVTDYLEKCNDKNVLQYRVIIADYGEGYEVITPRGFWGLYPKMTQPIELITDYVYPQSK